MYTLCETRHFSFIYILSLIIIKGYDFCRGKSKVNKLEYNEILIK